ncbi:MAG: hypothetical protein FJZ63_00970 [Chlamydiae bacterium]|nr:hypothetical protein [Chlamydiota bacterium]
MQKVNLFLSIDSREKNNPIQMALHQVMTHLGCDAMEQVVQGDMEADIVVTNDTATALRLVKETEKTAIVIMYLYPKEREEAKAVAERFPGRMSTVGICDPNDDMSLVPFLLRLAAQKAKEKEVKV